jgi:hypothetical protein
MIADALEACRLSSRPISFGRVRRHATPRIRRTPRTIIGGTGSKLDDLGPATAGFASVVRPRKLPKQLPEPHQETADAGGMAGSQSASVDRSRSVPWRAKSGGR